MCVCSLSYPASKAHAPYYIVICVLSVSIKFSHITSQILRFKKKLLNINSVFWFSVLYLSESSLILRRNPRDTVINVHRSSCKVPVILGIFQWNLNFLNIFSKKYSSVKFHENLPCWSRVFTCRMTNGQTLRS